MDLCWLCNTCYLQILFIKLCVGVYMNSFSLYCCFLFYKSMLVNLSIHMLMMMYVSSCYRLVCPLAVAD